MCLLDSFFLKIAKKFNFFERNLPNAHATLSLTDVRLTRSLTKNRNLEVQTVCTNFAHDFVYIADVGSAKMHQTA